MSEIKTVEQAKALKPAELKALKMDVIKTFPEQIQAIIIAAKKNLASKETIGRKKESIAKVVAFVFAKPEDRAKLEASAKEAALYLTGNGDKEQGQDIFLTLFGEKPEIGKVLSDLDVYRKVHKSFNDMKPKLKNWAAKGVVVEYNPTKLEYTLVSIAK